jgi:hypothetical protein
MLHWIGKELYLKDDTFKVEESLYSMNIDYTSDHNMALFNVFIQMRFIMIQDKTLDTLKLV